jgi:hypothetical protein
MTAFTIETLNALGARLFDRADSITNVARHEMEVDVRFAARVCSNLATLRFRWPSRGGAQPGSAATARDLRDALAGSS